MSCTMVHQITNSISGAEVDALLSEVNSLYSNLSLGRSDVLYAFGGLRPIDEASAKQFVGAGAFDELNHGVRTKDVIIDHSAPDNVPPQGAYRELPRVDNLISVEGVKYTDVSSLG